MLHTDNYSQTKPLHSSHFYPTLIQWRCNCYFTNFYQRDEYMLMTEEYFWVVTSQSRRKGLKGAGVCWWLNKGRVPVDVFSTGWWQKNIWLQNLCTSYTSWKVLSLRDVPDIRFRLAGYPAIFSNPVPAKTVSGTGYLSRIVLGPFWHLVELNSPSEWVPYCKTVGLHDSLVVSHVDQLFYIY